MMEYEKMKNLLENWIKINDEQRGRYTTGSDIEFKTTLLRSKLCYYADVYLLVKGAIRITGAGNDTALRQADKRNKGVIFKSCAPFIKCISKINNTETDNAQDIHIVMPMYNLV